jgi:hypothetical protein
MLDLDVHIYWFCIGFCKGILTNEGWGLLLNRIEHICETFVMVHCILTCMFNKCDVSLFRYHLQNTEKQIMDVNEYPTLCLAQLNPKERCLYCCSTFHTQLYVSLIFNCQKSLESLYQYMKDIKKITNRFVHIHTLYIMTRK